MTAVLLHGGIGVSFVLTACSLIVDTDRVQCEVPQDCADLGHPEMECVESICVAPDPRFSCRDTPWPAIGTDKVEVSLVARDLAVGAPVADLTVASCNTLVDTTCASPIETSVTDSSGTATLKVVEGFRGHFFLPSLGQDQAPYIVHMTPPPNSKEPSTLSSTVTITSLQTIQQLADVAERPFVEGRGHLFFTTRGCDGSVLSGVRVRIVDGPSDLVVAYLGTNGLPDPSLEEKGTGVSGRGALINVPPGFVTVRGEHDAVGTMFEQAFLFSKDTITSTTIVPSVF